MIASLINRHFQRDLRVRAKEVGAASICSTTRSRIAQFDFHNHDDPAAYNTLQKLSYVATIFVLIPVMILTGLAMSPAMDAAWPWLIEIFGGRQSARSIHFIATALLVGFIIVHLALVILAGPVGEVMSMITGRWKLPEPEPPTRIGARRMTLITRRGLVGASAAGAGLLLSGCDQLAAQPGFRKILFSGDKINTRLQRALSDRGALAPEFRADQMSPIFRVNGTRNPNTPDYNAHVASRFADWRVAGRRPRHAAAVAERSPISARCRNARRSRGTIASKGGARSASGRGRCWARVLKAAGLRSSARYIVFHLRRPLSATRPITNRSTWSTPSIPRRSWPGR